MTEGVSAPGVLARKPVMSRPAPLSRPAMIEHPSLVLGRQVKLILSRTEKPELPTGIQPLDDIILGFHRKTMAIVAGRPGEGKTALTLQFALNLAREGKRVIYVSLEMPKGDILERMLCNYGDLDSSLLRRGQVPDDFKDKVEQFKAFLDSTQLRVTEAFGYKAKDIETLLEDCGENKPDVIFIDHVNKVSGEGFPQRKDAVSNYTLEMERLAVQNNIAVVLLAQLNRKSTEAGGRPSMEHLKESGTLEEGAATILFLRWRTLDKERKNPSSDPAFEIIVGKQRYGDSGMNIEIEFHARKSKFTYYKQEVWTPPEALAPRLTGIEASEPKETQEEIPF